MFTQFFLVGTYLKFKFGQNHIFKRRITILAILLQFKNIIGWYLTLLKYNIIFRTHNDIYSCNVFEKK